MCYCILACPSLKARARTHPLDPRASQMMMCQHHVQRTHFVLFLLGHLNNEEEGRAVFLRRCSSPPTEWEGGVRGRGSRRRGWRHIVSLGLWPVAKCLCSINLAPNSIQSSGNLMWLCCAKNACLVNVKQGLLGRLQELRPEAVHVALLLTQTL